MPTLFAHVNIIAEDWEKLVLFYEKALDCQRAGVVRDLQGDDMDRALEKIIRFGGSKLGTPVSTVVKGAGRIRWVYARDPEGNIVELQKWDR